MNRKMKVLVNNKEVLTGTTTLLQLIEELALPTKGVAAAIDNRMVPRQEWSTCTLHEGAEIVIIKAACGG